MSIYATIHDAIKFIVLIPSIWISVKCLFFDILGFCIRAALDRYVCCSKLDFLFVFCIDSLRDIPGTYLKLN